MRPIIQQLALMLYGDRDVIPQSGNLTAFVPNVEVVNPECGHWIQQEKPEETNQAILRWLEQQAATWYTVIIFIRLTLNFYTNNFLNLIPAQHESYPFRI